MTVWQALLVVLGALIIGSLLGLMTIRLVFRGKTNKDQDHYHQTDMGRDVTSVAEEPVPLELPSKEPPVNSTVDKLELSVQESEISVPSVQSVASENSGMYAELRYNLSVAANPTNGELLPFRTAYWDTNKDVTEMFPIGSLDELTQAYTQIGLANDLALLSDELGHIPPALERTYLRLCVNITDYLRRMIASDVPDP
jgi:hypothetical protein